MGRIRTQHLAAIFPPLLLAACTLFNTAGAESSSLRIIPAPQDVQQKETVFKITSQTKIVLGEGSRPDDRFAAEQLNSVLQEIKNVQLKIVNEENVRRLSQNFILLTPPDAPLAKDLMRKRGLKLPLKMKEEGYILDVDENGIVLVAESPAGRYYGVMTLLQMFEQKGRGLIARGATIHDWPMMKFRGITDDLSRGQVSTMENFKKIIRFLGRHKLNVYSPYIEDIFVWKTHPLIGKGRGSLTAAEVKELDAYAKKHHVELIPIFETLGHWENILAIPEYVKYAEFPGAHTVNVSDETVYKILDEMIGELAAVFSSPYFNMAADESWDVGLGVNKERVAASDIATVHAEHYKRVFQILKKYKKKPMMYGDIILDHPDILDKIPKDVIVVDWHYGVADPYSSPQVFESAGVPFIVSPAVWNFTGPFPNYVNTFVNIRNLTRDGYLNGSLGVLTSNWNDYGGEALRELNYYGYAWTAECAWNPTRGSAADFNKKFFHNFFGSAETGLLGQSIYAILSDPLNQLNWHELWRHPLLPLRASNLNPLWRVQSLESSMPYVQQLLEAIKPHIVLNADQLPVLEFITRLNVWFAKKMKVGERVKKAWSDTTRAAKKDSVRSALLELTRSIVPDLMKLKEDFKSLWLKYNREANLDWLMKRYDRQAAYWEEMRDGISRGQLKLDPSIETQWIYHPNANPWKRDTLATQVRHAFFRKTFLLDLLPSNSMMQLIGDTDAKLWVNGKEIGEVFARRSLSLIVEHQRVKAWDIKPYLVQGKNVIAAEVFNYDQFGSAGVNIYAELPGTTLATIMGDSTWRVSDGSATQWNEVTFDDANWVQAVCRQYPYPVIRPNFSTGRLSWIER